VFWSKNTPTSKGGAEEVVKKAHELVADPMKFSKVPPMARPGMSKPDLIRKPEVLEGKECPYFDTERLVEEEKYDGYYAIVTSELDMPDGKIIDTYRGCGRLRKPLRLRRVTIEARPYTSPERPD
jgi:hypothetical protein